MLYTKQQLIDAYCAVTGVVNDVPSINAEVIRVQTELDTKIARITSNRDKIQSRIDNLQTDVKTRMKDIALAYLADQAKDQSKIDNIEISL